MHFLRIGDMYINLDQVTEIMDYGETVIIRYAGPRSNSDGQIEPDTTTVKGKPAKKLIEYIKSIAEVASYE